MINYFIYLLKNLTTKSNVDFFSTPPSPTNHFPCNDIAPPAEGIHTIESLTTLKNLLKIKCKEKQPPHIRFLVDTNATAWFANETFPGIKAPKHFQMTAEPRNNAYCKTAGNIKFSNSSCKKLKNINHQSGDFQPDFQSIKWILAILILNKKNLPFKLPKIIIIKELDSNGKSRKKHYWRISTLENWVKSFCHDDSLIAQLREQNKPAKTVQCALVS